MVSDIVYPIPKKIYRRVAVNVIKWCFIATAYICPIVNLSFGGKPWSLVVLWALWSVWSLAVSRDILEYNRISQSAKSLVYICIMLILIDLCISSGWAGFVVPIVSFGTLIIIGILLFSNLSKQKQNLMPMVWLIAASLVALAASFIGWPEMNWPIITLGATAGALLVASILILKNDLLRELKKRFHVK